MTKLIVGLGNPGEIYRESRHNIGRCVVKGLARQFKIKLSKDKSVLSKVGCSRIKNKDFIIAYPVVFINLSGESVSLLLEKYKVLKENLLVICDDLDLDIGRVRLRPKGSSGGHKGLNSIIEYLGTADFARLRIGIGRPLSKNRIKDFVLSRFDKKDGALIKKALDRAIDCCRVWLSEGIIHAMDRFN